jgi:hypothetical protein
MHPAEWIALITPALAIAGAGYAGVVKLTRITLALEALTAAMQRAAEKVDNHESRIVALEARSPGRHAAGRTGLPGSASLPGTM